MWRVSECCLDYICLYLGRWQDHYLGTWPGGWRLQTAERRVDTGHITATEFFKNVDVHEWTYTILEKVAYSYKCRLLQVLTFSFSITWYISLSKLKNSNSYPMQLLSALHCQISSSSKYSQFILIISGLWTFVSWWLSTKPSSYVQ